MKLTWSFSGLETGAAMSKRNWLILKEKKKGGGEKKENFEKKPLW